MDIFAYVRMVERDAARAALEEAAQMLERREGNEKYRAAWKRAAYLIREMKNERDGNVSGTDNDEQIRYPENRPVPAERTRR